eukprot:COSAG02_NODE_384_length_23406_cov_9.459733_20_plen_46_part_00
MAADVPTGSVLMLPAALLLFPAWYCLVVVRSHTGKVDRNFNINKI